MKRTLCIVAYDICSDRLRARALRAVKAFGLDGQKSVHECALSKRERAESSGRLQECLDPEADKLMILPLDPRSRIRALKSNTPATPPPLILIG